MASLLVLLMVACVPVAAGFMYYGYHTEDHGWFLWGGVAAGAGVFLLVVNFVMSGKLRCPLCMMPPLQNRRCSKHRTVKRIFGSHRLSVAVSILFKDSFRCPYCGEPTVMEVRERSGR